MERKRRREKESGKESEREGGREVAHYATVYDCIALAEKE